MNRTIGIVGGMGTYAGIDLLKKVADCSNAKSDPEHMPVIMISLPHLITDRTEYLLGITRENPGYAISDIINRLAAAGAEVVGIPCNTAHVPEIFNLIKERVAPGITILNMIEEVGSYIVENYPGLTRVGILGTNGVFKTEVYSDLLTGIGLEPVYPSEELQFGMLHPAIYDPGYGLKSFSEPVKEKAMNDILFVAEYLIEKGAEAIVLGCTEIPLAVKGDDLKGIPLIDPAVILAKALVRESVR